MGTPTLDAIAIAARLAKLEAENRLLKRLAAATALLSFVSAALVGGTLIRPGIAQEGKPGLETIQAYECVLRDSAGRMRVHLFFSDASGSPMLTLNDADGRPRLIVSADPKLTSISAYSPDGGRFQADLSAGLDGAIVRASRMERGAPEGTASLFAFKGLTNMTVEDAEGFRTTVGNASLPGATPQEAVRTSAASVVMYRKGGHVVWQVPPGKSNKP